MSTKKTELLDCPYCGRSAELYIGPEQPDTSMIHKIQCSYFPCLVIEDSLSPYSPDYEEKVNGMINDWNTIVPVIKQNISERSPRYQQFLSE